MSISGRSDDNTENTDCKEYLMVLTPVLTIVFWEKKERQKVSHSPGLQKPGPTQNQHVICFKCLFHGIYIGFPDATLTDQLVEESVIQMAVGEAEDVLLRGGAGNGSQCCTHGTVPGQARQPDGEHPDVVLFGLSGRRHCAGAAWVVGPVCHQQRNPQAAGGRLAAEHLGGVANGVGRVGAVADEGHGGHTALEDVQVLPVPEVVLHQHSAAVLQGGQPQA